MPDTRIHDEPTQYEVTSEHLRCHPRTWLVTGVAGFIGSNLLERLLTLGQTVVGIDNFATGYRHNLTQAIEGLDADVCRFRFIEGDIRDLDICRKACDGVDYILHQAAIGSVPRSIHDPLTTHQANVDGFLHMLIAARDAMVRRFVYASSSSTYGDEPALPKREDRIGRPLSPYAATKYVDELYAGVFQRVYGLQTVGLRYFNVFGRRQDPNGEYAAVIPRWVSTLLGGEPCRIYGDGETSRDFCYVDNVVQANILAATMPDVEATGHVYNVACGDRTTLNELFRMIRAGLAGYEPKVAVLEPVHEPFRLGDVRHSLADISKIQQGLGYVPSHGVIDGLMEALEWYATHLCEATADRYGEALVQQTGALAGSRWSGRRAATEDTVAASAAG
jgi:UDP-N-acetylglucosamine 4-epimerase